MSGLEVTLIMTHVLLRRAATGGSLFVRIVQLYKLIKDYIFVRPASSHA
jgi:hypothetical protein